MKKILIIPDVHGRDFWKEPVKQELKNNETSIVFLGAIVSRFGKATLSFPGGCELGPRPIDLHLKALVRKL